MGGSDLFHELHLGWFEGSHPFCGFKSLDKPTPVDQLPSNRWVLKPPLFAQMNQVALFNGSQPKTPIKLCFCLFLPGFQTRCLLCLVFFSSCFPVFQ